MEFEFKRVFIAFVVTGSSRQTMDSWSSRYCVHGHLITKEARKCFPTTRLRITHFHILEWNGVSIFLVTSLNRMITTTSVKQLLNIVTRFFSFVAFLDVEVHTGPLGCEKGSGSSYKSEWCFFLPKSGVGDKCWALSVGRWWMLLQALCQVHSICITADFQCCSPGAALLWDGYRYILFLETFRAAPTVTTTPQGMTGLVAEPLECILSSHLFQWKARHSLN